MLRINSPCTRHDRSNPIGSQDGSNRIGTMQICQQINQHKRLTGLLHLPGANGTPGYLITGQKRSRCTLGSVVGVAASSNAKT